MTWENLGCNGKFRVKLARSCFAGRLDTGSGRVIHRPHPTNCRYWIKSTQNLVISRECRSIPDFPKFFSASRAARSQNPGSWRQCGENHRNPPPDPGFPTFSQISDSPHGRLPAPPGPSRSMRPDSRPRRGAGAGTCPPNRPPQPDPASLPQGRRCLRPPSPAGCPACRPAPPGRAASRSDRPGKAGAAGKTPSPFILAQILTLPARHRPGAAGSR